MKPHVKGRPWSIDVRNPRSPMDRVRLQGILRVGESDTMGPVLEFAGEEGIKHMLSLLSRG